MSMHFIYAEDDLKDKWNAFVAAHAHDGGFLHSWQWGDFQKNLDFKVIRLAAIGGDGQLKAAALLVRHDLQFEYNYLYCPRGPVSADLTEEEYSQLIAEVSEQAKMEKSFMIRLEPAWPVGSESLLVQNGLRKSEYEVQPKCSFTVSLEGSEETLLASMKQKTRYNINLAQKKNVRVRVSTELSDIELFWQLVKLTSERGKFKPHTKEHYKKQFELLVKEHMGALYIAEFEDKVIGAIMVARFGTTAVYLHGASSDMYRDVMAPYLLQWYAMQDAKKNGCAFYDFGGVNGTTYFNEKWEGISRFKSGFAEHQAPREYVGSYEKVINPVVYSAYKFVKQIRG